MFRYLGRMITCLILLATLTSLLNAQAQQTSDAPAVPLPSQILAAKRIFIANGAGDSDPGISKYTGGSNGLYNQFSAILRSLGGYDLVRAPSDADLVLELTVTYAWIGNDSYPKFRLEIRDPKTNVLLWTCTERVNGALLAKSGRKNVVEALTKLADDFKKSAATQ
jgi:hypothetical protein